jgi:hypothetical protein
MILINPFRSGGHRKSIRNKAIIIQLARTFAGHLNSMRYYYPHERAYYIHAIFGLAKVGTIHIDTQPCVAVATP